jgi:hypothetical protein
LRQVRAADMCSTLRIALALVAVTILSFEVVILGVGNQRCMPGVTVRLLLVVEVMRVDLLGVLLARMLGILQREVPLGNCRVSF